MEYIAIKGRACAQNDNYVLYNCGTYIVRIWRHGLAWYMIQAIENAGICNQYALLMALRKLSLTKKWFRKLKYRENPKAILKEMKEKGLVISGIGTTAAQAVTSLFDLASFVPTLRPGTEDYNKIIQDEVAYMNVLHQEKLSSLERNILDWITDRALMLSAYPYEIVNSSEMSPKTYITIESLEKSGFCKGCSKDELIDAITSLYIKRCIRLADKVPHEFLEPTPEEHLRVKTYEIFA